MKIENILSTPDNPQGWNLRDLMQVVKTELEQRQKTLPESADPADTVVISKLVMTFEIAVTWLDIPSGDGSNA